MSSGRGLSCLFAKLTLATGIVGLGVGCYYAIIPNFNVVKVKAIHQEKDAINPKKVVERVYQFELTAGPLNYYNIDQTTITSQGTGEQDSNLIVNLVNESKDKIKSYQDVIDYWNKHNSETVIPGLTVENKDKCAQEFKSSIDTYNKGLKLLFIFGLITLISIIWMIINANIEHERKKYKKSKQVRNDNGYPLYLI